MDSGKIAEKLRKLRQKKGLTQIELSNKSGVPQQVISHYESGRNAIGVANLTKLARALNCKPSEIDVRSVGLEIDENTVRVDDRNLLHIVNRWAELSIGAQHQIMDIVLRDEKRAEKKDTLRKERMKSA